MIERLRKRVSMYKNKVIIFKYHGSRNQVEEFTGYIENIYPNVFTIRMVCSDQLRSFSYNDVLIHKLVFKNEITY